MRTEELYVGYKDVHRGMGVDLSERLLTLAEQKNWSLYFLGASPPEFSQGVDTYQRPL